MRIPALLPAVPRDAISTQSVSLLPYNACITLVSSFYLSFLYAGELTDEYRVGFRHEVNSSEDAKSEMVKLFQEAWEREQGFFFTDELPPITKYAEDILRSAKKSEGASAGGAHV
jgi:hypothetical protein